MAHEMWTKYGDDKMNDIINGLIGSCTMGTPCLSWYGIAEEDVDDVLGQIDEYVYECTACGWWCDGGDRYYSDTCGGDICEDCKDDYPEDFEDE